ncbi:MAG: hypothetical protein OXC30_03205 [Alphaproteobacteria bacterium]|nr:hypothetical protein [Alphaproteobacteria bacterium]
MKNIMIICVMIVSQAKASALCEEREGLPTSSFQTIVNWNDELCGYEDNIVNILHDLTQKEFELKRVSDAATSSVKYAISVMGSLQDKVGQAGQSHCDEPSASFIQHVKNRDALIKKARSYINDFQGLREGGALIMLLLGTLGTIDTHCSESAHVSRSPIKGQEKKVMPANPPRSFNTVHVDLKALKGRIEKYLFSLDGQIYALRSVEKQVVRPKLLSHPEAAYIFKESVAFCFHHYCSYLYERKDRMETLFELCDQYLVKERTFFDSRAGQALKAGN